MALLIIEYDYVIEHKLTAHDNQTLYVWKFSENSGHDWELPNKGILTYRIKL